MPNQFFLNYGGPGGYYFTEDPGQQMYLDNACRDFYGKPVRKFTIESQGLLVTIHTYGIHRAATVVMPDSASPETLALYEKIGHRMQIFCEHEPYKLMSNNCVTSVATLLSELSPDIPSKNEWIPWRFDHTLKEKAKAGVFSIGSTKEQFLKKYHEKMNSDTFSFLKKSYWKDNPDHSILDIAKRAHQKNVHYDEKTLSTLLDLGWVTCNEHGRLTATTTAPMDFQKGLSEYNKDWDNVQQLKQVYEKNDGTRYRAYFIFQGDADLETVVLRMKKAAKDEPQDQALNKCLTVYEQEMQKSSENDVDEEHEYFHVSDDTPDNTSKEDNSEDEDDEINPFFNP